MTGTALALIARCRRLGIVLAVHGDRLRYRPVDAVDDDLRHALAEHKASILSALAAAGDAPPDDLAVDPRDAVVDDAPVELSLDALDRRVIEANRAGETFTVTAADLRAAREWNREAWYTP